MEEFTAFGEKGGRGKSQYCYKENQNHYRLLVDKGFPGKIALGGSPLTFPRF